MTTTLPAVVEVLLAAADIIELDGWHQGNLYGPRGENGIRSCCALGAINRAEDTLRVTDFRACGALNGATAKLAETQPARLTGLLTAAYFNDHVATSADEVTDLLRATASEIFEKGFLS